MTVGLHLSFSCRYAAKIGVVLFSLKSAFDTFKKNLDEGDSLMTALGKNQY